MASAPHAPSVATLVAAVVMLSGDDDVDRTALDHQTVAPDHVATVDVSRLNEIDLTADTTHLWLLDGQTLPRPDALEALLREMARLNADVVGSKGLDRTSPEVLDSVGFSTDVLGETHRGFDQGELDQEQYDVVRDIGYVSAASMLVRRETLEAVGGLDARMDPENAALDLCNRVRLVGGRVVVAPSSEVEVAEGFRDRSRYWRREAGRIRSIIKAYSWVTLIWVLPMLLIVGIVDGVFSLLRRRFTLPGFLAAVGWNITNLPDTLRARRAFKRSVGDEELFRYQRRGSLRMSQVVNSVAAIFGSTPLARNVASLVDTGEEALVRPAMVWPAGIILMVITGSRSLWASGLPTAAYVAPFPDSAWGFLRSYAGGWNFAGLGSPEPYRPSLALNAIAQLLTLGSPTIGGWLVVVLAALVAATGMARLLDAMGSSLPGRYSGALVYIVGPGAWALSQEGMLPTAVAAAVVPWLVSLTLKPLTGIWSTIARIAGIAVLTGIAAAYSMPFLVIPAIMVTVLTLLDPRRGGFPVAIASVGALAAIPLLLPWIGLVGTYSVLSQSGELLLWSPSVWVSGIVASVFVLTVVFAKTTAMKLAAFGGVLMAGGVFVSRNSYRDILGSVLGSESSAAAIAVFSFGLAVVIGAAMHRDARPWLHWIGGLATVALCITMIPYLFNGRGGLPGYEYDRLVRFTVTAASDVEQGSSRILLVGPADTIPGDVRELNEQLAYRVVSAPGPSQAEIWLPEPRIGDVALEEVLNRVLAGETIRGGSELAPFGIRWIIGTGPNQLSTRLRGQLDLAELGEAPDGAFEIEGWVSRAFSGQGERLRLQIPAYVGEPGSGLVTIAENADARWGEPDSFQQSGQQSGWASMVEGADGEVVYQGSSILRNLTWLSGLLLIIYLVLAIAGSRIAGSRSGPAKHGRSVE